MVKVIEKSIFQGIAGNRPTTKPKYYILHNDAGSMTPESYVGWLQSRYNNGQSELGFAHYYINRNTIARVENTYSGTWSAANYDANMNSISYEVCEQFKASDSEFLANEDMVLRQMAEDMTYYGDTPNSSNIRFHNEFSSTSCPARSLALHGGSNASLREYVISKIKQYQEQGKTVQEMLAGGAGGWVKDSTGWWWKNADGSYPQSKWQKIDGKWYYFDASGYMLANRWHKHTDGKWYYLLPSGEMATGWVNVSNKWYYMDADGAMVTGWVKYKETWYFCDEQNGDMKSDTFIKGYNGWYYLKDDGSMATDAKFTVEPNGVITM